MRDLRKFARKLENPSPLILMEMTGKLETFRLIATDFSEDVIPQLRGAVETCGAPTDFATAFSSFLQGQDMPESVLIWIDEIATMMGNLSSQGQGADGGPTE